MTEPSLFSQRLKATRERKDLSIQQLSDLARVPYATIWRLETGLHRHPTLSVALALARALGVGIDFLMGTFEDEPSADLQPAGAGSV